MCYRVCLGDTDTALNKFFCPWQTWHILAVYCGRAKEIPDSSWACIQLFIQKLNSKKTPPPRLNGVRVRSFGVICIRISRYMVMNPLWTRMMQHDVNEKMIIYACQVSLPSRYSVERCLLHLNQSKRSTSRIKCVITASVMLRLMCCYKLQWYGA